MCRRGSSEWVLWGAIPVWGLGSPSDRGNSWKSEWDGHRGARSRWQHPGEATASTVSPLSVPPPLGTGPAGCPAAPTPTPGTARGARSILALSAWDGGLQQRVTAPLLCHPPVGVCPPQHPRVTPHLVGEGFGVQAQVPLQLWLLRRVPGILGDNLGHCWGQRGLGEGWCQRRGGVSPRGPRHRGHLHPSNPSAAPLPWHRWHWWHWGAASRSSTSSPGCSDMGTRLWGPSELGTGPWGHSEVGTWPWGHSEVGTGPWGHSEVGTRPCRHRWGHGHEDTAK